MGQRLFEYAVLYHPKTKKDHDGNDITEKSKVVVDVSRVMAGSEKEVGMMASRELPEEYLSDLERVEIIVRPF